jgi:hypothetical protein
MSSNVGNSGNRGTKRGNFNPATNLVVPQARSASLKAGEPGEPAWVRRFPGSLEHLRSSTELGNQQPTEAAQESGVAPRVPPVPHTSSMRLRSPADEVESRIAKWLDAHPEPSNPGVCAWCGAAETAGSTVVPFGAKNQNQNHTWLHPGCWAPWYRRRRQQAETALASTGVTPSVSEHEGPPRHAGDGEGR